MVMKHMSLSRCPGASYRYVVIYKMKHMSDLTHFKIWIMIGKPFLIPGNEACIIMGNGNGPCWHSTNLS